MKPIIKSKAVRRLKIVEGQIRGLQKMVEQEQYCVDIVHQMIAVKKALSGVEDLILKNHFSTHLVQQIKNGKGSKSIKEILTIYKLSKK